MRKQRMDSSRLIQRCKSGDSTAIEELVQTYQSSLYRLALLITDDPAEADEVIQDAFIAACGMTGGYRGEAALKTWLTSIVVNESRNRLRKRMRQKRLKDRILFFKRLVEQPNSPERKSIQQEKKDTVWQAILELGEKHRIPIILRYYQNLPVTEIAQILEINVGTAHSRLNTARVRLRDALSELEDENYE